MPMKYPPHPGRSILRDCIEPLGLTVNETARKLEFSPEELQRVIDGEAGITFSMAVSLDKLFGCGASTWYQLQDAYDRAQEANRYGVSQESEILEIEQQTATVPLEHGRLVFKTYDAEVISLRVASSDAPTPSSILSRGRVETRFVGEGAGALQIQMIYQPTTTATPRLVADAIFKSYIQWDEALEEYIGHIDSAEWNRESRKLADGKEAMNALYGGLREQHSVPEFDAEKLVDSDSEYHASVLKEAEGLLRKGTASVSASALAGV